MISILFFGIWTLVSAMKFPNKIVTCTYTCICMWLAKSRQHCTRRLVNSTTSQFVRRHSSKHLSKKIYEIEKSILTSKVHRRTDRQTQTHTHTCVSSQDFINGSNLAQFLFQLTPVWLQNFITHVIPKTLYEV